VQREEHEAFIGRLAGRISSFRRRWSRLFIVDAIAGLTVAAVLWLASGSASFGVTMGLCAAAFGLIYHWQMKRNELLRVVRAQLDSDPVRPPFELRVTYAADGFVLSWSDQRVELPFSRRLRVFRSRGWTDVIDCDEGTGFGIPDRAFIDEADWRGFVDELRVRVNGTGE
jgi:hypothetical protein